jgi:hypothetical protein
MCYIDGQKKKYSVLRECNRMLKYNINRIFVGCSPCGIKGKQETSSSQNFLL